MLGLQYLYTIHYYLLLSKNRRVGFSEEWIGNSEEEKIANLLSKIGDFWWGKVDSNHRSDKQQIYSLSPLATREFPHIHFAFCVEPVDGLEPPTCWLQISCSTDWAIPATHAEREYYTTRLQNVKHEFIKIWIFFVLRLSVSQGIEKL